MIDSAATEMTIERRRTEKQYAPTATPVPEHMRTMLVTPYPDWPSTTNPDREQREHGNRVANGIRPWMTRTRGMDQGHTCHEHHEADSGETVARRRQDPVADAAETA
jgi:hypothetical protein